ncbi:SGNH/GDSL hydrolase family protein [Leptospira biflexa]|uniref:SGNH/GDSL hydrolase family protein n=1 Tax=Leptospira biflexa TaxID=172 RepID=UPI00108300D1|nr:SGNH/GDSL hydrolase family protein [Leptospira biflexa]TGM37658.1 SGNH/GDSL hydrolase family protein [Leptospira biflexa]TGM40994.1 SGNH/GDSL hydrolase family protein [Leptospira biflexa]TGM47199.1 SGNH/GDSL hydrolase family protein [Leptospira biflexa]TGM50336.1 SGNH/GDSL hydrolase family protein [Leptospira biflexa]TGM55608.1 SGNH/GDSL hydrolase family protein [Leptospira biflexa]
MRKLVLLILLLPFVQCDKTKTSNDMFLIGIFRPTLGMFGDSIMALWPAEEQLKPFVVVKNAFPVRKSSDILYSIQTDQSRYHACIYNGGVNDFLGNFSPNQLAIESTVQNQIQALTLLQGKCDHILAINFWYVEFPWPTEAVLRLNQLMKERINFVPRLDTEVMIKSSDLLDGGHLTDRGYQKLADKTLEHFETRIPWIDFLPR